MEDFVWRAVAEAASRRRVQHGGHALKLIVGELGQVAITGQEAADPTIRILDRTFLPGAVRIAEEGLGAGRPCKESIGGELGATVEGDGAPFLWWVKLLVDLPWR